MRATGEKSEGYQSVISAYDLKRNKWINRKVEIK